MMTPQEIHQTCFEFVDLVENGHSENEVMLSLLLDKLALASHFAGSADAKHYSHDLPIDTVKLRAVISKRFPGYGYYNSVYDVVSNIAETEIVVGDAIDDILDITIELKEVLWHWHNSSIEIAMQQFLKGFHSHWASHLRELQLYIMAYNRSA